MNRTVNEIQGNTVMAEQTNNLHDPISALDEVHKKKLEEARLQALEEEDPDQTRIEDLDPLNGEIGELIQKSVK